MAFEQNINFRATGGYVTDAAKTHAETSLTANYPTAPSAGDSTAVGYESVGSNGLNDSRDRNNTNDARLAGIHFNGGSGATSKSVYKIALPAPGDYIISVAIGDANAAQTSEVELFDNASSLGVLTSGATSAAQRFKDATNVERTNATWVSSAATVTKTFASSVCRFAFGAGTLQPVWAHISVTAAASGPNITSLSTGTPREGASLVVNGTAFGASQGAGGVTINGISQTVTNWTDTAVTVTVVLGTNKFGAAYNVILTDSSANVSNTYAGITGLLPANSGLSYVDVGTPNTTSAYRLTSSADLVSGDQIEYSNVGGLVTVNSDATFSAGPGVSSFNFRVWTSGSGYGSAATQLTAIGSGISDKWTIRPFNKRSGLGF